MTSDYTFENSLIFFYKNIFNITKEPFLYIKSQLFRKPNVLVNLTCGIVFRIQKSIKKHLIKRNIFCKLILSLFTVCDCNTKSIYWHYNFINSGENVIRSSIYKIDVDAASVRWLLSIMRKKGHGPFQISLCYHQSTRYTVWVLHW